METFIDVRGVYNTRKEIEFLNGLGIGNFSRSNKTRKELLKGYLLGALSRTEWLDIQREKILEYCYGQLDMTCPTCGNIIRE